MVCGLDIDDRLGNTLYYSGWRSVHGVLGLLKDDVWMGSLVGGYSRVI